MILFRDIRYIVIKYHYRLLIVVLEHTGARDGDGPYSRSVRLDPPLVRVNGSNPPQLSDFDDVNASE